MFSVVYHKVYFYILFVLTCVAFNLNVCAGCQHSNPTFFFEQSAADKLSKKCSVLDPRQRGNYPDSFSSCIAGMQRWETTDDSPGADTT